MLLFSDGLFKFYFYILSMRYVPDTIVRTPLSGMVHIEDIVDITGQPYFERQKRMKQTGLVYTVYPGATHTRYEHVIDTLHNTRKITDKSLNVGRNLTKAELSILQILAVLHDISHGPYSHQSEFVLQQYTGKTHNDLFMDVLDQHFNKAIEKCGFSLKEVEAVYRSPLFEIINVIHGTDKLSYIASDGFHALGEKLDLEPLYTWSAYSTETGFCINEEGVPQLRNFLEKWYQMHNDVYWQKTILSNYTLLHRAMVMLIKDGVVKLPELMSMTDEEANRAILSHPPAAALLQRIFNGPNYWYEPIVTFKIQGRETNEVKERGKGVEIVPVNKDQASKLNEVGNNHALTEIEKKLFAIFDCQIFISTLPQPERMKPRNPKIVSSDRDISQLSDRDTAFFGSLESKADAMWVARIIAPSEDRERLSSSAEKIAGVILDEIKKN